MKVLLAHWFWNPSTHTLELGWLEGELKFDGDQAWRVINSKGNELIKGMSNNMLLKLALDKRIRRDKGYAY